MSLEQTAAYAFLGGLQDRFRNKIDPEKYYLSYSGGKDSHLLYWFIKEWLHEDRIVIVGVNTGFELAEIRNRIIKNSDVVLHPVMHRNEIKRRFGTPCFTKQHDEYIDRYQKGNRSKNTMDYIMGNNPKYNLSKKARNLLLSGNLPRISRQCCVYNKEKAMQAWDQLLRALRYSYAPESEQVWNDLPEITKQCVGGYATFRAWGNTENSALESVQRPMFMKRYEVYQKRDRIEQSVPDGLRKKPLPTIETMAGEQKAIEADTEKRDTVPAPSDHMKRLRERLRA